MKGHLVTFTVGVAALMFHQAVTAPMIAKATKKG
jgi:hypothetical protein